MASGSFVDAAPHQQKLAGDGDAVTTRRLQLTQILAEAEIIEAAWNDQTLGEAAELVPRREREHIESPGLGRRHCARSELRRGAHVRVQETKPLRSSCRLRARPAREALACPAGRQRRSLQEENSAVLSCYFLHRRSRRIG